MCSLVVSQSVCPSACLFDSNASTCTTDFSFRFMSGHTGDCDFENGYCLWKNDFPTELIWILNAGYTPSVASTGPLVDHTKGTDEGVKAVLTTVFL